MLNTLAGIIASSGGAASGGDYESIATVTVGSGGTSTITFSSIPSTYQHLQIRYIARNSSLSSNTVMTFNSDSAGNYSTHYVLGNGASASSAGEVNSTYIYTDILSQTSTSYAATIVDVLDYKDTNKYTTARSLSGLDMNGSGTVWLVSGAWRNTAAVNSITFKIGAGFNFAEYSSFALYGIKG